ncbi:MAG: N-acetylmuramoyl-L-alanine amidase [Oscillospiraceae bacterium]|nr:N-acetylmuramoyl-L-alanine amidase [Oscillospiraceae bacterium]
MKKIKGLFPVYFIVIIGLLLSAIYGSYAATVISENAPVKNRKCIVIDAGHGGVDGGAVSCTGVLESQVNLEIALKLNDLCHLLGLDTKMIRTTDCSIHTQGSSIAAKKVSDLKERVRITNETENAVIVSIHQNKYVQSQYSGAQVFYAPTEGSSILAKSIQDTYLRCLNSGSNRKIKKADGVYLMQHITCPGVLVECGFLSNPEEEARLRNKSYQQKLCCVIASACSGYLNAEPTA